MTYKEKIQKAAEKKIFVLYDLINKNPSVKQTELAEQTGLQNKQESLSEA